MSSEFQTQIQPQRPVRVSKASQTRTPIGRWVKEKADIEYPFEHGEVINYTLDGVSIHPVTTKIQTPFLTLDGVSIHPVTKQIQASFLTQLPERKETAQSPMVTLKQLQSFMAVIGEN